MKPIRILLVEDDDRQRDQLARFLNKTGFSVTAVRDGLTALNMCLAHARNAAGTDDRPFDLLLTDYDMPGISGIELTELLRKSALWRSLPVFLITGHHPTALRWPNIPLDSLTVVGKPVDLDRLTAALQKAV